MDREQLRKRDQRKATRLLILEVIILMSGGFVLSWFLRSVGIDLFGLIEGALGG